MRWDACVDLHAGCHLTAYYYLLVANHSTSLVTNH